MKKMKTAEDEYGSEYYDEEDDKNKPKALAPLKFEEEHKAVEMQDLRLSFASEPLSPVSPPKIPV